MSTSRREFIILGSGAIAAAAFGVPAPSNAAEPAARPFATVGHWGGVPKIARRYRSASFPYLVPAESLLTGDPVFFSSGARIEVHGFWRPEADRESPASFSLDVAYDAGQPEKVPFYAWSFATGGGNRPVLQSSRVGFDVPVDALDTMDVVIRRGSELQEIKFTVNSADGALKLRPGYYFVALREHADEQPIDWTRIRMREGPAPRQVSEGPGMLMMAGSFGELEPVPFSYLVLWIEVAGR